MTKLHADHYADQMSHVTAALVANEEITQSTYRLRVHAPEIATQAVPGQFVMIRLSGVGAPLIGRALAIYDVADDDNGRRAFVDLVYLRKGALTTPLSQSPIGTQVDLWGPLGNGFSNRPCQRLIMAVGGIGQTPMLMLGRDALQGTFTGVNAGHENPSGWADHAEIIYGARTSALLAGVDDFRGAGFDVRLCTDDGSTGTQGRVPDVLAERLDALEDVSGVRVVTCGPEIMMQKVAQVCADRQIDCQVSMETPMACGIGICFSCVAKVNQDDGQWDYKRTCVEGPIFDAPKICWD